MPVTIVKSEIRAFGFFRIPDSRKLLSGTIYRNSLIREVESKFPSGTWNRTRTAAYLFFSPRKIRHCESKYRFLNGIYWTNQKIHKQWRVQTKSTSRDFYNLEISNIRIWLNLVSMCNLVEHHCCLTERFAFHSFHYCCFFNCNCKDQRFSTFRPQNSHLLIRQNPLVKWLPVYLALVLYGHDIRFLNLINTTRALGANILNFGKLNYKYLKSRLLDQNRCDWLTELILSPKN